MKTNKGKKCKHEYRAFVKANNDTGTNESFYCVYCLEIVFMHFYSFNKTIKNPHVKSL